jgi:hypothetical protein
MAVEMITNGTNPLVRSKVKQGYVFCEIKLIKALQSIGDKNCPYGCRTQKTKIKIVHH